MAEDESVETVKYYTRARKFPQLLGRMPDGTKIPGGPYTVQQLIAAIAIIVVGGLTIGTWGVFGFFGNIAVLFGSAFGAVFLIGRLPMNGRNPFFALVGLFRAIGAPATGRYQGRPIRMRRPRRLTHRAMVVVKPPTGAAMAGPVADGALLLDGASDELRRRLLDRSGPGRRAEADPVEDAVDDDRAAVPRTGPLSGVQALLALVDGGDDGGRVSGDGAGRDGGNERRKVVR